MPRREHESSGTVREAGQVLAALPRAAHPRPRTTARDIATVGFAATAIAYGPARMGFGLFLPDLRAEFGLDESLSGLLGAALFASFLLSALVTSKLTERLGPRPPVVLGALLATVGLALVALAPSTPVLALGLVVAGASPGLCWSPFNDAATSHLTDSEQPHALSAVSTGTTLGVLVAGLLAGAGLLLGLSWRWSWLVFAVGGALAALLAVRRMPQRPPTEAHPSCAAARTGSTRTAQGVVTRRARLRGTLRHPVAPVGRSLHAATSARHAVSWPVVAAASFGLTSSLYLAFAGTRVESVGGTGLLPADLAAPVLFAAYGLAGLLGLLAGAAERRVGLRVLLVAIFAASGASTALLGPGATSTALVLASAGLQGAAVMLFSAVLSFWTARLHPTSATRAFTHALVALAAGGALGPALAGVVLEAIGPDLTYLGAGVVSLLTGAALAVGHPDAEDAAARPG